jgi:ribosomal protein L11 methyltransferase
LADFPALEVQFLRAPGPDAYLRERLYALLDDFSPTAIQEDEAGEVWRVFFATSEQRDAAAAHLASLVSPDLLRTSALEVPDEDWARRSQQNLKAVTVDGLVIAPPWDVPAPGVSTAAEGRGLPVVVMEPSKSFVESRPAMSRTCLSSRQQLELRGARVVDVGTGSGVLALAAWKLGAGDIVAVDNDPDALDNARSNIARNGAGGAIDVIRDELGQLKMAPADVVMANLTAALLVRHVVALVEMIRRRGYLVLSGFAPPQGQVDVMPAFRQLRLVQELVEGDWQAVLLGA